MEYNWFNIISGTASIIGLIITFITWSKVRSTKKSLNDFTKIVLFNTRCPDLINKIRSSNSAFINIISSNDNDIIRTHLNELIIDLKALGDTINVPHGTNSLIKRVKKQFKGKFVERRSANFCRRFVSNEVTLDELRNTYHFINRIIKEIENNRLNRDITH